MSHKYRRVALPGAAIVVVLLAIVCLVAAKTKRKPIIHVSPPANAADKSDVQGLVFAILPTGFIPADVELTDGRYLFIIQNRCGIRDLTFQLDRQTGGRLHEVHDQKLQWKKQFDLQPGTYVLSVVDHPAWRSVIKVKPH